jgi:hypothetical protein
VGNEDAGPDSNGEGDPRLVAPSRYTPFLKGAASVVGGADWCCYHLVWLLGGRHDSPSDEEVHVAFYGPSS